MATIYQTKTGSLSNYLELTKPGVVTLHLITASAAMLLAAGGAPTPTLFTATLIGGGLTAAAANTLNCYLDRDIDKEMARTRTRALPSGRLKPADALAFAAVTGLAGFSILLLYAGLFAAILAMAALVYYVLIYTLWLKRCTCWGAMLGSGAGAFPPLIGWVAITGRIEAAPLLLFAIITLWTPPHFWSLAIIKQGEYTRAGLMVLPQKPRAWITAFSASLIPVSALIGPAAGLGWIYGGLAAGLGVILVFLALKIKDGLPDHSRTFYRISLFYLPALFAAMAADRVWAGFFH